MDDPYAVDRRGFLMTGAVAAAATAAACGKPASRWRALTEEEAKTLAAACDQIVPPDQDPGASEAGLVTFVDRQLATRQRKQRRRWQAGRLLYYAEWSSLGIRSLGGVRDARRA